MNQCNSNNEEHHNEVKRTVKESDVQEIIRLMGGECDDNASSPTNSSSGYGGLKRNDETPLSFVCGDDDTSNNDDSMIKEEDDDETTLLENKNDVESTLFIKDEEDDNEYYDKFSSLNNDLVEFIEKAKQFGANALDLSKKNLNHVPRELMSLPHLQYIYLEGNSITSLPSNFFKNFNSLIWLDLRNNKLESLPTLGLTDSDHPLRYLLLENNNIRQLPSELGLLRHLTALNVANNPITYPPEAVIQRGCKYVLDFLRGNLDETQTTNSTSFISTRASIQSSNNNVSSGIVVDDVWASDNEEEEEEERSSKNRTRSAGGGASVTRRSAGGVQRSTRPLSGSIEFAANIHISRIRSSSRNILIARSLQPKMYNKADLKERLLKAKISANNISKNAQKLLEKRGALLAKPPNDTSLLKNEELEKAVQTGKIEAYKRNKERIDANLQKVNDRAVTSHFRDTLKSQQRKLAHKRMIKGVDYVECVHKAPFDISQDHLMIMTNEERAYLDKKLEEERMRPLSPSTLWKMDEERRIRDHAIQERIRQYTQKIMARRDIKSSNPKQDKAQAARDLRELQKIEREIEQRRKELQFNYKAFAGAEITYKETAKRNAKISVANILKSKKSATAVLK